MIEVSQDGAFWTITLNRPEKANSLTRSMLADIRDAARTAEREDAAALVLTGRGGVFSAGADLEEACAGLATDGIWEEVSNTIATLPCLTVAALNGTLAGGAFGMALACDLRVSVPGATFFYPVMKLGFLPQPSDPGRLAALVGPARAKMILMASEKIDAATALDWGLVDQVVAEEALEDTAHGLCAASMAAPPNIRSGIKSLLVN